MQGLEKVWPQLTPAERTTEWFRLPLDLRKKYWKITTYDRDPPTDELVVEMRVASVARGKK